MLQKYRDTETQIRNNQLNTGQFWGLGEGNTFKIQIHKSLRCVGVMCVCQGCLNFFSLLVFFLLYTNYKDYKKLQCVACLVNLPNC